MRCCCCCCCCCSSFKFYNNHRDHLEAPTMMMLTQIYISYKNPSLPPPHHPHIRSKFIIFMLLKVSSSSALLAQNIIYIAAAAASVGCEEKNVCDWMTVQCFFFVWVTGPISLSLSLSRSLIHNLTFYGQNDSLSFQKLY
jgi:hypothetical protein